MPEHQVTIVLKLWHRKLRTPKEGYSIHELSSRLAQAALRHHVGKLVGHESTEDECRLQFRGPNADRLFNVIRGPLFASTRSLGGHVIKRYGPPGVGHKEERLDFDALRLSNVARAVKRRTSKTSQ